MKMLTCPECGLTITDTQKECPKCRTKLEDIKEELQIETEDLKKKKKEDKKSMSVKIKEEMIAAVVEAEAEIEAKEIEEVSSQEDLIAAVVEAEALAAIEEEALVPDEEEEIVCETCMAPVEDGQNFCASCGSTVNALDIVVAPIIPKTDEESNRLVAALGYICFFFPILFGFYRKSAFAKFHTKQATVLFFFSIISLLLLVTLRNTVDSIFYSTTITNSWHQGHGISAGALYHYIIWVIYALHLTPFAMMFIGIINALRRKKNPLPVIGRFTISEKK